MKQLLVFWRRDLINKLIVMVILALMVGMCLLAYLLVTMPKDSLLMTTYFGGAQQAAGLPTLAPKPITPTAPPTPTTRVFPTLNTGPSATPTPETTQAQPTPTDLLATIATITPTPTFTVVAPDGGLTNPEACIPSAVPETARVVDVVDGNTIRVYMNESVYVVRYIGIGVPRDGSPADPLGPAATLANAQMVFGRDVLMYADTINKDANGRLLRYVLVGKTFVNYEMLGMGMASLLEEPKGFACALNFTIAQQQAKSARLGIWVNTP